MRCLSIFLLIAGGLGFGSCSSSSPDAPSEKESDKIRITKFRFTESFDTPVRYGKDSIVVTLPYGTDLSNLTADYELSSPYAVLYANGEEQIPQRMTNDFRSPVIYSVITSHGEVGQYVVVAKEASNTENRFRSFRIGTHEGIIAGTRITVQLPGDSSLNRLLASFSSPIGSIVKVGDILQVSGKTMNDFQAPVTYTLILPDNDTIDYTVFVKRDSVIAINITSNKDSVISIDTNEQVPLLFRSFSLNIGTEMVHGKIEDSTIIVEIPADTISLSSLIASFTVTPSQVVVKVGDTVQVSGTTPNDFSSSVSYLLVGKGKNKKYRVIVYKKKVLPATNEIISFTIGTGTVFRRGRIQDSTITVILPFGTSLSDLKVNVAVSKGSSLFMGEKPLKSAETFQMDFQKPVVLSLISKDRKDRLDYKVNVRIEPPETAKDILSFSLNRWWEGTIIDSIIHVKIPFGQSLEGLTAYFKTSGEKVLVNGVEQISGKSKNNFVNPVIYTVVSESGDRKRYFIFTDREELRYFSLNGRTGKIENDTIRIAFPENINLSLPMKATFDVAKGSSLWIGKKKQISGMTLNSFRSPVFYELRTIKGRKKVYTVIAYNQKKKAFRISPNPLFPDGGIIDKVHTWWGAQKSPSISWEGLPVSTKSIVLVIKDMNSHNLLSKHTILHWGVYGISPTISGLKQGQSLSSLGLKSFLKAPPYKPIAPAPYQTRRYRLSVYATTLPLEKPLPIYPSSQTETWTEWKQKYLNKYIIDVVSVEAEFTGLP